MLGISLNDPKDRPTQGTASIEIGKLLHCSLLIAFCSITMTSTQAQASTSIVKSVTAEQVCTFITTQMNAALPHEVTLCAPKHVNSLELDVSVFSPTPILEGKFRRAWSSALFMTLSALYSGQALGGACKSQLHDGPVDSEWLGCVVQVSDSYLAQHGGKHYQMLGPPRFPQAVDLLNSDPSSDQWYRAWWLVLGAGEDFERKGSSGQAKSLAEDACKQYLTVLQDSSLERLGLPIPECSVLLTTDNQVDVLVSFPDFGSQSIVDYEEPLLEVFGHIFDDVPYTGYIVFKGKWLASGAETIRPLWLYDLRRLKFLWEESSSGVRPDASFFVRSYTERGQTEETSLSVAASGGILLKTEARQDGSMMAYFINGGKWLISADSVPKSECLPPGEDVVPLVGGRMMGMSSSCTPFKASFAGAW